MHRQKSFKTGEQSLFPYLLAAYLLTENVDQSLIYANHFKSDSCHVLELLSGRRIMMFCS